MAATLASVVAQRRRPAAIIVVDDGTPVAERRALEALPEGVQLIRHETNRGIGAARRTGTAAVTTPYVAYLDADDRWPPDYLERMVAALETHPEAPGVYTAIVRCWPDGTRIVADRKPVLLDARTAIVQTHLFPSASVFRRDAIAAAGGWPDDRRVIDDWHLTVRLLDRCGPIRFVPGEPVEYAVGNPRSLNSRDWHVLRQWWQSLRQLGGLVEKYHGPGSARRRFAKALADRADRRRGVSRRMLHLAARVLGPPLTLSPPDGAPIGVPARSP